MSSNSFDTDDHDDTITFAVMNNEHQPEKTPEVISLSTTFNPQSLAAISLVVALLFVIVIVSFNRKRAKAKGNTFLLVGPSDAGKTTILSQLVYAQTLPTQTSMQTNSAVVSLSSKKSIRIVDVPGHARLRDQFQEYLPDTKTIGFVVDANSVSRNAPAVAEHLHHILRSIVSLPPSQQPPALLILAHKADLFKTTSSNMNTSTLAVNRVKAILERELEKRRASQSGGFNVEGLGEEGERSDMGGLECGEKEGSTFKFDDWEGGEITFIGTSIISNSSGPDEKGTSSSLEPLWQCLEEFM